jgi:hypothetical protein
VVEGRVINFHPMPSEGHRNESFTIENEYFSYLDFVVTPCFNNSSSHGGPIRPDLPFRVSYSGEYFENRTHGPNEIAGPTPGKRAAPATRGCITFPRCVTLHRGFLTLVRGGKYTREFRRLPAYGAVGLTKEIPSQPGT